jgi:hypothetical protein
MTAPTITNTITAATIIITATIISTTILSPFSLSFLPSFAYILL